MRKFIAVYEIVGGIVAFLLLMFAIGVSVGSSGFMSWKILISILLVGCVFALFNLFSGIQLIRNKNSGFTASIILQILQLVSVQGPMFHEVIFTPVAFLMGFSKTGISIFFGFGTKCSFIFEVQPVAEIVISINVIALVLLASLIWLYRKKSIS